jgi:hypothetical protein
LEWSVEKSAVSPEIDADLGLSVPTAFMPDYEFKPSSGLNKLLGRYNVSAAGIAGGGLTFLAAGASAFLISRSKKRKERKVKNA